MELRINQRVISRGLLDLYLIAEIGVNYYEIAAKEGLSLLEAAKKMIFEAKEAGCDAVKFQIYKAERLASKFSTAYWDTTKEKTYSQYELFKKYDHLGPEEYFKLADYASNIGIDFLATVFDIESLEIYKEILPSVKVASADITNKPYLEKIAELNKPIILSTGASYKSEIWQAIEWIRNINENVPVALLHCILNYPTTPYEANLGMIRDLYQTFPENVIGYSDHVVPEKGLSILQYALLLGANILEKHFTLDKTLPGNDHYHAMDPQDVKKFRQEVENLKKIVGENFKKPLISEEMSRKQARRSIVAKRNIKKGEVISKEDLDIKRPGFGIEPKYFEMIGGSIALENIKEDEILTWEKISINRRN